jgi:hypothetical protein
MYMDLNRQDRINRYEYRRCNLEKYTPSNASESSWMTGHCHAILIENE